MWFLSELENKDSIQQQNGLLKYASHRKWSRGQWIYPDTKAHGMGSSWFLEVCRASAPAGISHKWGLAARCLWQLFSFIPTSRLWLWKGGNQLTSVARQCIVHLQHLIKWQSEPGKDNSHEQCRETAQFKTSSGLLLPCKCIWQLSLSVCVCMYVHMNEWEIERERKTENGTV